MSHDPEKTKFPFHAPMIPDELCGWLGKVFMAASEIDQQLNTMIAALLKASGDTPKDPDWRNRAFPSRSKMAKDEAKAVFAENPAIAEALRQILIDAGPVILKRNRMAHGRLVGRLTASTRAVITAELTATARLHGELVTDVYMGRALEFLFYEAGHISGRLRQFAIPDQPIPGLSSADIDRLRGFLVANHSTDPNP
jgi:hypothetical protein